MEWLYKGDIFTEEMVDNHVGFVYTVTDLLNGKKYIGKKLFSKAGYKQVNGKKKKIRKQSDWANYYGSCEELCERVKLHGPEHFKREILHLCKNKSEATYLELREQIDNRVLESDGFYNDWIFVRVRKSHLKGHSW